MDPSLSNISSGVATLVDVCIIYCWHVLPALCFACVFLSFTLTTIDIMHVTSYLHNSIHYTLVYEGGDIPTALVTLPAVGFKYAYAHRTSLNAFLNSS